MLMAFAGLDRVVAEKKIKVTYTKGYRSWKVKFDRALAETKSVPRALDLIHGRRKGGE